MRPASQQGPANQARSPRDRAAIVAFVASTLAAITCLPFVALFGGVVGFMARRRARSEGRPARLATAAIVIAVLSIATQWLLWDLSTRWLLPSMQRRMSASITAACEGRWQQAVPADSGLGFAQALPAPGEAATTRFAERLRAAHGTLRGVSLVNQEISGSPMSPTVTAALVLEFDRGTATGSARLQWLPSATEGEAQWLPTVRLLELEVSVPTSASLVLQADEAPAADSAATPPPTP
ncbi:MAG: DUF4190 domain-containing protein [Betaproteobacteria bacterium]|nr:DUF4190 domain-containing protein [Betaproteobacteria bacterium]